MSGNPSALDRTIRVLLNPEYRALHEAGRRVFATDEALASWMMTSATWADGARPIDLASSEEGRSKVVDALTAIAHGNFL